MPLEAVEADTDYKTQLHFIIKLYVIMLPYHITLNINPKLNSDLCYNARASHFPRKSIELDRWLAEVISARWLGNVITPQMQS